MVVHGEDQEYVPEPMDIDWTPAATQDEPLQPLPTVTPQNEPLPGATHEIPPEDWTTMPLEPPPLSYNWMHPDGKIDPSDLELDWKDSILSVTPPTEDAVEEPMVEEPTVGDHQTTPAGENSGGDGSANRDISVNPDVVHPETILDPILFQLDIFGGGSLDEDTSSSDGVPPVTAGVDMIPAAQVTTAMGFDSPAQLPGNDYDTAMGFDSPAQPSAAAASSTVENTNQLSATNQIPGQQQATVAGPVFPRRQRSAVTAVWSARRRPKPSPTKTKPLTNFQYYRLEIDVKRDAEQLGVTPSVLWRARRDDPLELQGLIRGALFRRRTEALRHETIADLQSRIRGGLARRVFDAEREAAEQAARERSASLERQQLGISTDGGEDAEGEGSGAVAGTSATEPNQTTSPVQAADDVGSGSVVSEEDGDDQPPPPTIATNFAAPAPFSFAFTGANPFSLDSSMAALATPAVPATAVPAPAQFTFALGDTNPFSFDSSTAAPATAGPTPAQFSFAFTGTNPFAFDSGTAAPVTPAAPATAEPVPAPFSFAFGGTNPFSTTSATAAPAAPTLPSASPAEPAPAEAAPAAPANDLYLSDMHQIQLVRQRANNGDTVHVPRVLPASAYLAGPSSTWMRAGDIPLPTKDKSRKIKPLPKKH